MPRSLAAIPAVIVGLMLAACSAAASPSQAPGGAQDSASEDASGGGEAVEVSLSEFEIDMPTSIPAGHVTFNVTNDGTTTHALEVEGNGIEEETEEIAAGDSATLEVDLEAGTYEVYCPVDDHRGMGMELDLEVTGS
jgi:uncharacterized cupredoxin-like copper-binding protein